MTREERQAMRRGNDVPKKSSKPKNAEPMKDLYGSKEPVLQN